MEWNPIKSSQKLRQDLRIFSGILLPKLIGFHSNGHAS